VFRRFSPSHNFRLVIAILAKCRRMENIHDVTACIAEHFVCDSVSYFGALLCNRENIHPIKLATTITKGASLGTQPYLDNCNKVISWFNKTINKQCGNIRKELVYYF